MPKERFHLLLADECFKILGDSRPERLYDDEIREAFFLGSIMPDTLFYDLPYFSFSPVGKQLHVLEGDSGFRFFRKWLEEERDAIPRSVQFWMLGMTAHYLADGFWHPVIGKYAEPHSRLCRELKMSSGACHFWMESQMESYWLPGLSPPDGYRDTLKSLRDRRKRFDIYFERFRNLIQRAGAPKTPRIPRIQRCFYWQTTSLRMFAHPRFAAWKSRFLDPYDIGKTLSALVVPPRPAALFLQACAIREEQDLKSPCNAENLAGTVSHIVSRLRALPVLF